MAKIACLGCGLVGEFVARHLISQGHEVIGVDLVNPMISEMTYLATDALQYAKTAEADVFVNLLPGRIGDAVRPILVARDKKIVDLAFSAIDPSQYSSAKASLLWDVGIAPGLSNMLVAMAERELGKLDEVTIKVGGNPLQPDAGWSYMAPFSPSDVIEEYTRPARIIREGKQVILPALEERHLIDVDGEQMEAFLTDGLRSLIDNIPANNMAEYTVRWPGHIDKWLNYEGTEEDLLTEWQFKGDIAEFTWLEVICRKGEHERKWVVRDDGGKDGSSMARTTGLVTAKCAMMMAEGEFENGVIAPEHLADSQIVSIIEYLRNNMISVINY